MSKMIINVQGEEVVLDDSLLEFTEASLSKYIEREGGHYNYFGGVLARSEEELQLLELDYDVKYSEVFADFKEQGGSDKLVEAKTKAHSEVIEIKKKVIEAKKNHRLIRQHLAAWDKNHENAQSMGHNLRKEMDKLQGDIYWKSTNNDADLAAKVDQIIGGGNK